MHAAAKDNKRQKRVTIEQNVTKCNNGQQRMISNDAKNDRNRHATLRR